MTIPSGTPSGAIERRSGFPDDAVMTSHHASTTTPRRRLARFGGVAVAIALLAAACSKGAESAAGPAGSASSDDGDTKVVHLHNASDRPAPEAVPEGDLDFGEGVGIDVDAAEVEEQADGSLSYSGELTVPTTGGDVDLENAELIVVVDPDTGEAQLVGGRATLPFPTTGVLAGAVINNLPVGDMGIAFGRELHHLGAHLNDDREYMYFAFDGGLDIELPFAGEPGFEAIPPSIAVPTGVSAVLVLDPSDPYFYIGSPCPDLSKKDDDTDTPDSERDDTDRRETDRERDEREAAEAAQALEDDEESSALVTLEPTDLPPGEDCGIGFSLGGHIPAPATANGEPFTGHVVVDGIVPLYAAMELDGSVVVAVGPNGARTAGWGDVLATVPLIDSLVDITIPLAEAAVEIQAEGTRIGVAYDGVIGGNDPTYELPLLGIPITIPSSGEVKWDARFGFIAEADGTWSIDPTSFAEVSGNFGLGLGRFGELIGVPLDDALTQEAFMRIDSTGVVMQGSMDAQIHPSLSTGGAVEIDVFVSAADWTQSHLYFDADVDVLGHQLAAASVSLDNAGLFVNGSLDLGALEVEMGGAIDATGVDLSGRTAVELDLSGLADASRNASAALDDAIAAVESLDREIDAARAEARQNRLERDAGFVAARAALDNAIDGLDVIDDNVATNSRRIRELERKIADEQRWYDGLSGVEAAWEWTGHAARLTGWRTEIAALHTANVTQRDIYRPAAVFTLEQAQNALQVIQDGLNALPVDTNPKVAALIISRETALVTLKLVQDGVELFEIEGSLRGELVVSIGTAGLSGSIEAEACGSNGCITLGAGRLVIGAQPELCVEFPGIGEQCLNI